jgi:hypothetical protein
LIVHPLAVPSAEDFFIPVCQPNLPLLPPAASRPFPQTALPFAFRFSSCDSLYYQPSNGMLDGGTGKQARNNLIEAVDASPWNAMPLKVGEGADMTMP